MSDVGPTRRARSILRRHLALVFALFVVIVAVFAIEPSSPSSAAAGAPPTWRSGVFDGYGPSGDLSFGKWRGLPIATATDYTPEDSWASIDNPTWDIQQWSAVPSVTPVLSVPLWPNGAGTYDLADAAAGDYNSYFVTLAQNLVAGGLSHAILRIGWEPDGTWYGWSVGNDAQAEQYAAAWRQIVAAIQQVPGEHFGFDWCLNLQPVSWNPADAYPGDNYVSEIGEDVYDWNTPGVANQTPAARWKALVNEKWGLGWQASFAAVHNKPISFPEWALVADPVDPQFAGGDDPAFIQHMHGWFASHNVALEDYFDSDSAAAGVYYGITTGNQQFPKATARYKALF